MKSMVKKPAKRARTAGCACPSDANVRSDSKEQSSALASGVATTLPVGVEIAAIRANITGVLNEQGRQHRQMPPGADVPMPKRCYVYAINVDGVLRYFGKGTNGRMYAHMKEVRERLTRKFKVKNVGPLFQQKLTEAVMKGAVVEEVVLEDNLTSKQAYKLEYRYLEKMVHDGRRLQLWNIIPPSIYTPREHEAYVKKLTENLASKDRWTRIFARMQLIRLGRYEDDSAEMGLIYRQEADVYRVAANFGHPGWISRRHETKPNLPRWKLGERAALSWNVASCTFPDTLVDADYL